MRSCFLILLSSLALVSCVNLKPKADSVKLYSLGPTHVVSPPEDAKPSVHVARPSLPTYLISNRLQYRSADGEVRSIVAARWAEPLQEGVARALAEWLQVQAVKPAAVGTYYPWQQPDGSLVVRVHLHQFCGSEDGRILFQAAWQLESSAGVSLAAGIYQPEGLSWMPGDAKSLIAGLNAALQGLSAQVAEQL